MICLFIFYPSVEVGWKCPWEIGVLTIFFFNRPSNIFCNSCKSICQIHFPDPSVLKLWLRVAKIGALISFTHKTSVWSQWESEQNAMEDGGLWSKVWVSNPIPYLPSLKEGQDNNTEPCQEMAKVYIYKKLWSYKYICCYLYSIMQDIIIKKTSTLWGNICAKIRLFVNIAPMCSLFYIFIFLL